MQSIFVQEDGTLDSEACIYLGLLMKNKISKFDLEMICGVHFQGKGDNREIGVSLATAITEASVQKFIQVLRKQHEKLNVDPVVRTTTTDTANEIVTCIPNIVPNLASGLPSSERRAYITPEITRKVGSRKTTPHKAKGGL